MLDNSLRPLLFCLLLLLFAGEQSLADEAFYFNNKVIRFELKQHEKLLAKIATTGEMSPFSSDGCSGGLSVGWQYMAEKVSAFETVHGSLPPWESCCVIHDRAYYSGAMPGESGNMSYKRRKDADRQLKSCILATGKTRTKNLLTIYNVTNEELDAIYQTIAELMYNAVRLGGIPCSGLPWRWGFGWPGCM